MVKNKYSCFFIFCISVIAFSSCKKPADNTEAYGTVKVVFKNKVKNDALVLNTQTYTNSFNEEYSISKFKYYISNVALSHGNYTSAENNSYHLIDAADPASQTFSFNVAANHPYQSIHFLIGVDSLRNVSGAQTGALDPVNDMFWTWNSGYIMAKLEGNSPASPAINHKIEYHIGGFSGINNVLKPVVIDLGGLNIQNGKTTEIIIDADINTWWQDPNDLKFANSPVSAMPGELSKKYADNYRKMFTLKSVTNL